MARTRGVATEGGTTASTMAERVQQSYGIEAGSIGLGRLRKKGRGTFQLVIKTCRAATPNHPISTLHSGCCLSYTVAVIVATAAIL